ncbi:MAG TPA: hypothetical protein VGX48_16260 [Pyrinomonadaceae bacterium]|jgi:hypothetical protein|nr:hypothetical protein [Pyrinomonadaceae bacterium]
MSTNLKAVEKTEERPEEEPQFTEELPPLSVDPTSFYARAAGVESCSLLRELSKHWGTVTAFQLEQEQLRGELKKPGEATTYEESWEREKAIRARSRELWLKKWEPKPQEELDEDILYIKRKATQYIDWGDLGRLWNASPLDAIHLWMNIRQEARDEFISGHYAARVFETADYMHKAFDRAQHLAIRDGLIEEWKPRGASEFILIDQMTQAYVMQIHWTEEAMRRAQTEPRVESYEYRQYAQQRKIQAKQWGEGYWDIPYQQTAEAIEQAFRLVELCQKAFQRAARQLANIRLVRAKTARMRRRERAKTIKGVRVA